MPAIAGRQIVATHPTGTEDSFDASQHPSPPTLNGRHQDMHKQRNRTRRTPFRVAVLAAALLAMTANASAEQVLRVATHAGLSGLDPIWTSAYITRNHGYMIFDALFALDESFEVQPQMVDTWQVSEDGLAYTLTLREGLAWHDGDPVTPADCIASIRRWGERDPLGRRLMTYVDTLDVMDDRTFVIKLTRPYARVLASLAKVDWGYPVSVDG